MTIEKFSLFTFLYDNEPPASNETPEGEETPQGNETPEGEELSNEQGGNKTFTQDDVSRMIAAERRKIKQQTEKTISDLEQLRRSNSLTKEENEALNKQIEDLRTSLMTKEQLAEENKKKMAKQHQHEVETLSKERDTWKERYTESTIQRTLTDAAVKAKAVNPEQVIALLKGVTHIVEQTDDAGNSLGIFTPRVKIMEKDENGNPKTLDLSVDEAITRMRDLPDSYGNLFQDLSPGGMGGSNQGSSTMTMADAAKKMTPEQYRKFRKERGI